MRLALVIAYGTVLGAFLGGLIAWTLLMNMALQRAQATVDAEMRQACHCWFTDSRCKVKSPTVVCTKPEWMNTPSEGLK